MERIQQVQVTDGGHLPCAKTEVLAPYEALLQVQGDPDSCCWAVKDGATGAIHLTRLRYRCGRCDHFFSPAGQVEGLQPSRGGPPSDFCDWALQTTLFGPSPRDRRWQAFSPLGDGQTARCPHCGFVAGIAQRWNTYLVKTDVDTTGVSQRVSAAERRRALPQSADAWGDELFPLELQLTFQHAAHSSGFRVLDCQGRQLWQCALTEKRLPLEGWLMSREIGASAKLQKALAASFGMRLHPSLRQGRAALEEWILFNRFQGYPSAFYRAVPFAEGSRAPAEGFGELATLLADKDGAPAVYERFGLPRKKAVRRAIFESPGLLFYARELAALPFHNPDVLLRLIRSPDIFRLLSILHTLPGVSAFLGDLVAQKGEVGAWRLLSRHLDSLVDTASKYLLFSAKDRSFALRKNPFEAVWEGQVGRIVHSFPVAQLPGEKSVDGCVGKFRFAALRATFEYREAGTQLHNCLRWGNCDRGRVIGVKVGNRYVAAIELEGDLVVQAEAAGGRPIHRTGELAAAFRSWAEGNHLSTSGVGRRLI